MRATDKPSSVRKSEFTFRALDSLSSSFGKNPEIIYEDNHVLGLYKPAMMLVQGDQSGDLSLLEWAKSWLKEKYAKPGNVFLGLVHRLDLPVAGVVLFAKTSKAASRLSEHFRTRKVTKIYHAWVEGNAPAGTHHLSHFLGREGDKSIVSEEQKEGFKSVSLTFREIRTFSQSCLLEIDLHTGRKHQIRSQLSAGGYCIIGDKLYGSRRDYPLPGIALLAKRIEVTHPVQKETKITLEIPDAYDPILRVAK